MTTDVAATWQAWSAVVQAIGSILAIIGAIAIANWQHRQNIELVKRERERIEQQDRKRDQAVLSVATAAIAILSEAFNPMNEARMRAKALVYEPAERKEIAKAAEELRVLLRVLRATTRVVIRQFQDLKPVYQSAGAEAAIFHFHTLASLKDIERVSDGCGQGFDSWNYSAFEPQIEPSLQEIESFHLSITDDLSRLYPDDSHRPAARPLVH
ncbi:hypothetical protein [Xanthomonas nasturtii]|uniref:hypothetical protein n=1 Tax=Xanthomonas nasturtii TaxID=1843581 RepID=UPI0020113DEF|nr:hypothetical protein [Xanthomonas nasturtii]MCL1561829.1 hypothetical protein [Xanthomonas nasturtii]